MDYLDKTPQKSSQLRLRTQKRDLLLCDVVRKMDRRTREKMDFKKPCIF